MKKIGCSIGAVGLLLTVGSLGLFGSAVMSAIKAHRVCSVPIEVGVEKATDSVKVDTARLCQIGIHVDLKTESVNESDEHLGEKELKARYEFPFSYRVTDPEGTLIHSESGRLAWNANGTRMTTYENVTPKSGTVVVEHSFEKFSVPSPGEVTVTVNVQPDTTYEATANKIELRVYDNVSSHAASVGGGAVMICFGPMLVGVGLLVLIIALVTDASNKRDPRTI